MISIRCKEANVFVVCHIELLRKKQKNLNTFVLYFETVFHLGSINQAKMASFFTLLPNINPNTCNKCVYLVPQHANPWCHLFILVLQRGTHLNKEPGFLSPLLRQMFRCMLYVYVFKCILCVYTDSGVFEHCCNSHKCVPACCISSFLFAWFSRSF